MAVHVRYNSWYISLPSSAKQQRGTTIFCVVWITLATKANFVNFFSKSSMCPRFNFVVALIVINTVNDLRHGYRKIRG